MTLEQLIALGLSEEIAKKVLAAYEAAIKDKFVPIARFNEVNEAKKQADETIKERDKQLKELAEKAKGNDELTKQIKELQDANEAAKKDYEAKIKDLAITSAIQSKLTDTKYPELLVTKFDRSKLSVAANGTVLGIDEQLKTIKEQYKDLFVPPVTGRDANNKEKPSSGQKNPWSKEHFNLTEQGRILRENPELAKQLRAAAK